MATVDPKTGIVINAGPSVPKTPAAKAGGPNTAYTDFISGPSVNYPRGYEDVAQGFYDPSGRERPPEWMLFYQDAMAHLQATTGAQIDRPWSADEDARAAKENIDKKYIEAVDAYNKQYGTNLQPNQAALSPEQRTPYSPKPHGFGIDDFLKGALSIALPVAGGVYGGPWGAAAGGALAGGAVQGGGIKGAAIGGGISGLTAGAIDYFGAPGVAGEEIVDPVTGVITRAAAPGTFDVIEGTPLLDELGVQTFPLAPGSLDVLEGTPLPAETDTYFGVGSDILGTPASEIPGFETISDPGIFPGGSSFTTPTSLSVPGAPESGGSLNIVPGGGGGGGGDFYGSVSAAREASGLDLADVMGTNVAADTDNYATKALKALGLWNPEKGTLGPTALPLGFLTASQIMANQSNKSLQRQLEQVSAPASAAETTLLNKGLAGEISAAASFDINKWTSDQKAAINQRYANMGRDPQNDSAAAYELSQVDAQAVAMRDAAAQAEIKLGLDAAGLAQGPAVEAALAGAQQDQELTNAIAQMLQLYAIMQASQGEGGR